MPFYKAICAKNNKKIELMVQKDSLEEARSFLHGQWYSIIEINETAENESQNQWNIFYFDIEVDWKIKIWSISSNDIFKAYLKLVDHYNVIYIYDQKDAPEKYKILITEKIKQSYEIFKKQQKDAPENEKVIEQKNEKKDWASDFLKKELEKYYSNIDKILEKIEFILNNYSSFISQEKKDKLENLYNSLKQIKNITNITKLKLIWETALIKIWELQIELIWKNIIEWKKEILWDTNKLLKNFGSTKHIILPEDDLKLKMNKIFNDISEYIKNFIKQWTKAEKIDKTSWKYFDILRELEIYKRKLKDINKEIFKSIFNKEKNLRLKLKKKLILQNITLINNRIKNKKISYSKTIKWFSYYNDILFYITLKISDLLIYTILVYSLFFIIMNIFRKMIVINYWMLYFIILLSLLWFILKISKNIYSLLILAIIYFFSVIYLIINF